MMGLFSGDSLKGGFFTTMIIDIIRGILNRALLGTTPKQLRESIANNTSLWGEANGEIMMYVKGLPSPVVSGIDEARKIVDTQYGGFDQVVLKWLETDHPLYYNIIVNTPDGAGTAWLRRQIYEILDGVKSTEGGG
jgi:hypothetical protein